MSSWIVSISAAEPVPPKPLETAEVQKQLEQAARDYARFATDDIISNRPTRDWPAEFIAEQAKLMLDFRKWSAQPDALRSLIDHKDPKVRTLALGALFVSEDPSHLPQLASRMNDEFSTFPHVHQSGSSAGFVGNVDDLLSPQTVGEIAKKMLYSYEVPSQSPEAFDNYWKPRQMRKTCATWTLVKVNRATRSTSPPQPEYKNDVKRVLAELIKLPLEERVWNVVYLRCRSSSPLDQSLTDEVCLSALKEIGPDSIVTFLERKRVTQDPDLWFDNLERNKSNFHSWMAHYVLRHAKELLREQDAPALLAREDFERKTNSQTLIGTSPYWAAATAELVAARNPAAASEILNAAQLRFPLTDILGGRYQAVLISMLWKIHGHLESSQIVDWFYRAQAKVIQEKSDSSNHDPCDFLDSVNRTARKDIPELMRALISDPRFQQTDWPTLKSLLDIASAGLQEPLVSTNELYKVWPVRYVEQTRLALADWRELLRRHYTL